MTNYGPRHRVFTDTSANGTVNYYWVNTKNGNSGSEDYDYLGVSNDRHEMSDVVVKDYYSRIKRGDVINNECTHTRTTSVTNDGSYTFVSPPGSNTQGGLSGPLLFRWMGLPSHLPASNISALISDAKVRALAQIDPSEFSFGEDAGEALLMMRNLRNIGPDLLQLTKEYVLRREKIYLRGLKPFELEKALTNLYLMYQFLFQPLVRSADSAIQAFHAEPRYNLGRFSARGFSAAQDVETSNDSSPFTWLNVNHTTYSDIQVRAHILYEGISPFSIKQKLGFRNVDLPETAWQLFPYSFMIDRLVNISTAIRAFSNLANPSINILAASVTTKSLIDTSRSASFVNETGGPTRTGDPGTQTLYTESYVRNRWSPSLLDVKPPWHPGELIDESSKVADLFALILTRLLR